MNRAMTACIEACEACHRTCLGMAMTHCLNVGGKHVEPTHFRLMHNCAEICQTAANVMLSDSPLHARVCGVCAEVCDACGDSCAALDGMEDCVNACRRCAESCRKMAASG